MTDTADMPIACTLSTTEQAARRDHISREVLAHVREITELPDGYVVHVDGHPDRVRALAEFVAFEHACCPFLRFRLDVESGGGPARLHLTGPGETKAFLRTVLTENRPEHANPLDAAPRKRTPGRGLLTSGFGMLGAATVVAVCCVPPLAGALGLGAVAAAAGGYLDAVAAIGGTSGILLVAGGLYARRRQGRQQPHCRC